jgi:glycosyltransferase involved in cell wall biosynthesis
MSRRPPGVTTRAQRARCGRSPLSCDVLWPKVYLVEQTGSVRALVVTNLWPTPRAPDFGGFVHDEVEGLRALGIEIDVLHLDRLAHGRSVYLRAGRNVRRRLANSTFDLVHVMYGGVMAEIVTRRVRDVPVLVSFCGTDLLARNEGGLIDVVSRGRNRRASLRAARRSAGIVVKSGELAAALPPGIDRGRVWVIPDGVDLALFAPRDQSQARDELGWSADARHVIFPSDPARPEKNFPLAAQAVESLQAEGLGVELHALTGLPKGDVPTWLNAADALVLTSTHEGSPNAVKEALACNVPVVSVDVGDVRERLADIDGCYLADATAPDVADKLRRVLERGVRLDARARVDELSLSRLAERLRDVYTTLVA